MRVTAHPHTPDHRSIVVHGVEVLGLAVDPETRCAHYHSARDIVAIRFRCCGLWYPCYRCHEALADHPVERWQRDEFGEKALLCGACGTLLGIAEYLGCGARCPACGAAFNPGCHAHHQHYFEP